MRMFPPNEVRVWRARVGRQPAGWLPLATGTLSEEERARQARFVRERDAELFALGRAMLRRVLAASMDVAPRAVTFEAGPFGKPRLAAAHRAPFRFNPTHSGDLAVVAITVGREVGVDVEAVRPLKDLEGLVRATFSAREQRDILAAPEAGRLASFFAAWARKEAVVKALGHGLRFPLDAFDVEVSPEAPPALLASREAALVPSAWIMHALPPMAGYASALAVERAMNSAVTCEEWTCAASP